MYIARADRFVVAVLHCIAFHRANKRIISLTCLLCLMAGFNALYIPLHLEDLILRHPDAALMQVSGRLPEWQDVKALTKIQQRLQQGDLSLGKSFVLTRATQQAAASALSAEQQIASADTRAGASKLPVDSGSFVGAAAMSAFPAPGDSTSWSVKAVGQLNEKVSAYCAEPRQCPDLGRLKDNILKHYEEILRMQVSTSRRGQQLGLCVGGCNSIACKKGLGRCWCCLPKVCS